MKIKPFGSKIQIKVDESKAGSLYLESMPTAIECGEAIAIGPDVEGVKVGDKLFYKSWAVDIVTHEGVRYFFIDLTTNGVCAIIG